MYTGFGSNSASLTNCIFKGNSGGWGGGMSAGAYSKGLTLTNCSFSKNAAAVSGGGIFVNLASATLSNCVLWDNYNQQIGQESGAISLTYSCVQGGWPGVGNIDANPIFVSVAAGDLRLGPGSPCFDAGNNAAVPSGLLTDMAGFARFFDDPNVADCQWFPGTCGTAPIVDMGAYESNGMPPPIITQQPTGQTLCEGGTATFAVAAAGAGTLTYQWQKAGVDLVDGGRFFGATTTTLTVTSVIPGDNGDYSCIVTDANDSTSSGDAALVVKPATIVTQQPANATGTPAMFTIAATADGTLAYQWQRNGANLTEGIHYTGTTTPTLTVAYCACGATNTYRCVVMGGCTVAVSEAATLTCQPGDFDSDADVDQEDFGLMQVCLGTVPSITPACRPMDLDNNGEIDSLDAMKFAACKSGPQVPGNPSCGK